MPGGCTGCGRTIIVPKGGEVPGPPPVPCKNCGGQTQAPPPAAAPEAPQAGALPVEPRQGAGEWEGIARLDDTDPAAAAAFFGDMVRVKPTESPPPRAEREMTEGEMLAAPIDSIMPVAAKSPQAPEAFETAPGMPPVIPAYNVCAASYIRIVPGFVPEDTTHQASLECGFPGCPMGMCDEHAFPWEFDGETKNVCWQTYRDLRGYQEQGHPDPWLALIGEDNPEMVDYIVQKRIKAAGGATPPPPSVPPSANR